MKATTILRLSGAVTALSAALPAFAQETPQREEDLIIVTASPVIETVDESLIGVSVLEGDALRRRLQTTIGDTLRQEPGISATSFGQGASRPIIRGQGGDRIRVLTNGVGTIDAAAASPDHAVPVEPALAERIEIVRGTGLLRYGSSGAGGVVNVIDGTLPSVAPEDGIDGAVRFDKTTVDDGESVSGGVTALLGQLGGVDVVGHVSGSWRDAEDYDIPGFAESATLRALEEAEEEEHDEGEEHEEEEEIRDTLPNSFVENTSIAGGLSFIGERGFLAIGAKQFNSEYGIPGGHEHAHEEGEEEEGEEEEEEGDVFIDLDQFRLDVNGRFNFASGPFEAVQFFAGYADYEHTEFEGPGEPGTVFANEGGEVRAELIQRERGPWEGATGIQWRTRDFSAIGEEAFVPPTETDQIGIYTFQEYHKGPWQVEGAFRYENTEHTNPSAGIERSFDGFSVSGGLGYEVSDAVFFGGTVFRTERAPTTEELFSNGPHLATDQFERGDVTLDEEVATGIEGVFRFRTDRGGLTVTAFYTDYSDYIFEAETGEEEDGLPVFQFTGEDAQFTGFEIDGDIFLGSAAGFDITADAVLDIVNAEIDVSGNDNLPRIPPFGANLGLSAETTWLALRAEAEYSAEQDDTAAFELPTDSFTLFNFYADITPFASAENVTLSVALLNATDEEARLHTSFLKDEVPLPGRNVRVSLRYGF